MNTSFTHIASLYRMYENEKRRHYNQRICDVEHGSFTPLVFSTTGGASPECNVFLKNLADKISNKSGENYSSVMQAVRTRLNFSLLRSQLICLRGTRGRKIPYVDANSNEINFRSKHLVD